MTDRVIAGHPSDREIVGRIASVPLRGRIPRYFWWVFLLFFAIALLFLFSIGWLLIEGNQGYRLVTHPRFARWVRILRAEPPPVKLSQSSIETLAIVAYRQPVTRGEIEMVRGVSAEAGVNKLLERELIYVVGRADLPGRPIQYGTTDTFLEFVGVKSLDELPASDVLSSRQIDEWLKTAMNPTTLGDTEMGLPNEQLPLEPASAEAVSTPSDQEGTATTDASNPA